MNPNNISKIDKRSSSKVGPERPGTDLGAIWRQKRSKDAFSLILVQLLVDVGRMLDNSGWIFDDID